MLLFGSKNVPEIILISWRSKAEFFSTLHDLVNCFFGSFNLLCSLSSLKTINSFVIQITSWPAVSWCYYHRNCVFQQEKLEKISINPFSSCCSKLLKPNILNLCLISDVLRVFCGEVESWFIYDISEKQPIQEQLAIFSVLKKSVKLFIIRYEFYYITKINKKYVNSISIMWGWLFLKQWFCLH